MRLAVSVFNSIPRSDFWFANCGSLRFVSSEFVDSSLLVRSNLLRSEALLLMSHSPVLDSPVSSW